MTKQKKRPDPYTTVPTNRRHKILYYIKSPANLTEESRCSSVEIIKVVNIGRIKGKFESLKVKKSE